MAITATLLYQMSQITPSDLGKGVIDFDADEAAQETAAIVWIGNNILNGAISEVSAPLRTACGYGSVEMFVSEHPRLAGLSTSLKYQLVNEGSALFDKAVTSYGRSELNKTVNSSDPAYDKDSDQDRIQGNNRTDKLVSWAKVLILTGGLPPAIEPSLELVSSVPVSQSVRVRNRF